MKKKFILFILLIVFCVSILSVVLILNFVDPYSSGLVGVISLIISFLLSLGTFFTLFLYILKKAYYRGDVFLYHVYTSFRQGFFISMFLFICIFFYHNDLLSFINASFLFLLFFFSELFIRNIEDPN